MCRLFVPAVISLLCASPALAQQGSGDSSVGETPAAAQATPESGNPLKAAAVWIGDALRRDEGKPGFYAEFGGLPPGSGISGGPGYRHELFGGRTAIDASTAVSWSRSTAAQGIFEVPRLAHGHLSVGAQAARQDFTSIDFYGVGSASPESDASQFGLTYTDYRAFATAAPRSWLSVTGRIGYSPSVTIRRPRSSDHPATQDVFIPGAAPGLGDTPAFLHSDVSIDADTRNHRARPTSGGDYRLTVATFHDRESGRHSFRQIEGEASRFIPILHENWVIALRGRVAHSGVSAGNTVPFYLLPTLGGGRSLRGYGDYRFRDYNLLLLNAEYRWRVFGALDGALFYDAGNVQPRFADLDLTHLKTSYGIGFRFHSNDTTFFRLDVGRSAEGTRLLVGFNEALRPGHGSIFVPYVP
jgi:outer membrane protein assembly factor BamA